MNNITKIVVKSTSKIKHEGIYRARFTLKENYISYKENTDNPNCSMFMADIDNHYTYKVDSETFSYAFEEIANEVEKIFSYIDSENGRLKHKLEVYYSDGSIKTVKFSNTLEKLGYFDLANLFRNIIPSCELNPEWLEIFKFDLNKELLEEIEKKRKELEDE